MGIHKNSIDEKMNQARLAINNTLDDPEIQERVKQYGYTPEKMFEGKKLYDDAYEQVNEQVLAVGTQKGATTKVDVLKKQAIDTYQSLAQVCNAIFVKDKSKMAMLGLTGEMPKRTPAFLQAAYSLFDNAQKPEIQADLAKVGFDISRLQKEREVIVALDQAIQKREQTKGEKQQSTREKWAKVICMDDWVKQYLKIAKVALKDKPELLEKLGVRILSTKTTAQRKAAAKAAETRAAKLEGNKEV